MHTIIKCFKAGDWQVVRCEVMQGETIKYPLFNRLSFNTAMAVANSLNGGSLLSPNLLKVLEMCKA